MYQSQFFNFILLSATSISFITSVQGATSPLTSCIMFLSAAGGFSELNTTGTVHASAAQRLVFTDGSHFFSLPEPYEGEPAVTSDPKC